MKGKIFFVVPWAGNIAGSTFMRGFQLCDIAKAHLSDHYDFGLTGMPVKQRRLPGPTSVYAQRIWAATRPRDAVYIVTKQCIELMDPVAAEILQSRARAVLFDYVDGDMGTISMRGADIHLCSSAAQADYMSARKDPATVALVAHGFDARFPVLPPKHDGPLRAVYVGVAKFNHMPDALRDAVRVFDVTVPDHMMAVFDGIGPYNLHYCVRPVTVTPDRTVFKPFTKGATAAACGANVLVNRDTHDAEALLGADYPYFVESLDDAGIIEGFAKVEDGIGGPEWRRASEVMADLADQTSPARVAAQLHSVLRPLFE